MEFRKRSIALILLIGGKGERFSSSIPKQFLPLLGKPLYLTTLYSLINAYPFDQIILPTHEEWVDIVKMQTEHLPFLSVIAAGKTRQESSYLGQKACHDAITHVMIHDGNRPFVSERIIKEHIEMLAHHKAIDTCIPATDTIVTSSSQQVIDTIPQRSHQMYGQTPQSFDLHTLQRAHLQAMQHSMENATDDCGLCLLIQEKVHIVLGDPSNFKITTPFDYDVAKMVVEQKVPSLKAAEDLSGKIYAMPGGFGEMGLAITDKLHSLGAEVIPLNRDHLSDALTVEKTFKALFDEYGLLDGLINVAGFLKLGALDSLTPEEIKKMLYDNLEVTIYACKFAKLKKGGHILNFASTAAKFGRQNYAIYSSAKAAVVNFTEGLAQERKELFVNILSPARALTQMRRKNFPTENTELLLPLSAIASKVTDMLSSPLSGMHLEMKIPEARQAKKPAQIEV